MNVHPGDLAISVNTQLPENEGVIVRVVRRHVNDAHWNFGGTAAWWCVSDEQISWFVYSTGEIRRGHEGPIPDRCLKPIRARGCDDAENESSAAPVAPKEYATA